MQGVLVVATGGVRVVSCLFVVAGGVVLGCLLVMGRCVGVVLGGFGVMFGSFLAHFDGVSGFGSVRSVGTRGFGFKHC